MNGAQPFTLEELWYLWGQFSPAVIIGAPDPSLGMLEHEIDELRSRARKNLLSRHLIRGIPGQPEHVSDTVADWVRIISNPEHTILINQAEGGTPGPFRTYHFEGDRIVELVEVAPDYYSMREVENRQVIADLLTGRIAAKTNDAGTEPPLVVGTRDLERLHTKIRRRQLSEAKKTLRSIVPASGQVDLLVRALSKPVVRMSVVSFLHRRRPSNSETRGFSLVADDENIWRFVTANDAYDQVMITRITNAELDSTIQNYLPASREML